MEMTMSNMPKPSTHRIEGRVAQILNAQELAINRGNEHGVQVGMKFSILSDKPLQIIDPETKDVVGTIDREKVRVEVTDTKDKFAICRTYRYKTIPAGPLYDALDLFSSRPPRKVPETLAAKDSSLPPPLDPDESYVKINDRVIQVPFEVNPAGE
jgi:hypothetical protein